MYEFHWLEVPFCPGTSCAMVKLKSAAGRPCSGAPFWSASWNFTTGGPLMVTLVIVPVIAVAVLILGAAPEVMVPAEPVAPAAPAGPDGPMVPLQAASSALSKPALSAPNQAARTARIAFARNMLQSPQKSTRVASVRHGRRPDYPRCGS